MFEKATRNKLRFATSKGQVSVEELWDMSLDSLDTMAVALDTQMQQTTKSFVKAKSTANTLLETQLDILKHIINVKIQERDLAKTRAENKAKLERLKEIQARKLDAEIESTSLEDLGALIASLEASI